VTVWILAAQNEAASVSGTKLKSLAGLLGLCAILSIMGFLVVNNLTTAHGVNQDVRAAMPTSNLFFMAYDIQMMFSCILAIFVASYSIPYCLDLEALKAKKSDA
jgi:hypothetical protein